jgi:hypothetical protein
MAQKPGAVALAVLTVGFALASCAFQSNSTTPVPDDTQPAPMTRLADQEGKKFSAIGSDADCVLTTGDIHFWCKWIARYY